MSAADVVPRDLPFPDRMIDHLRYTYTSESAVNAGTTTDTGLDCTPYLPNNGSGVSARFYNQLAAIYSRYRVLSVRYRVQVASNDSSTGAPCLVSCVVPSLDAAGYTTVQQAWQLPYSTPLQLSQLGGATATHVGYVRMAALLGLTEAEYLGLDGAWTATGSAPTQLVYLHVLAAWAAAAAAGTADIVAELDIEVEWSSRLDVPHS
jgi:hypothetical protein